VTNDQWTVFSNQFMNSIFMEIDNSAVYPNVQYSTWNNHKFLHICADSLNFSSFDLTSFNICNDSSFVKFNETNDAYNAYDADDAYDASYVSNRGLIHHYILKLFNNNIDNNCDNKDFFIHINFRRIRMFKKVSILIAVHSCSISFHLVSSRFISSHLRGIINQTLISNHTTLIATLICYFYRMHAFLILFQVFSMIKPVFRLAREQCQQYNTIKMLSEYCQNAIHINDCIQ
jgi:hypothetical protein